MARQVRGLSAGRWGGQGVGRRAHDEKAMSGISGARGAAARLAGRARLLLRHELLPWARVALRVLQGASALAHARLESAVNCRRSMARRGIRGTEQRNGGWRVPGPDRIGYRAAEIHGPAPHLDRLHPALCQVWRLRHLPRHVLLFVLEIGDQIGDRVVVVVVVDLGDVVLVRRRLRVVFPRVLILVVIVSIRRAATARRRSGGSGFVVIGGSVSPARLLRATGCRVLLCRIRDRHAHAWGLRAPLVQTEGERSGREPAYTDSVGSSSSAGRLRRGARWGAFFLKAPSNSLESIPPRRAQRANCGPLAAWRCSPFAGRRD
eukprot:2541086-Prymnesium_polylepis.1